MSALTTGHSARWITERATVLSQEADALWVAADKTSACGSCKAKAGCGTSLLAKLGSQQVAVRALLPAGLSQERFVAGEDIELAIDRTAFVKVALVMYITPLIGLVAGVVLSLGRPEFITVLAGIGGLFLGGWLASVVLKYWRDDEDLQPVVLRRALPVGESVIDLL